MSRGSFNPCPCMNLQKGSMTLAMIDAVLSMISFGLMILALVGYIALTDDELTQSQRRIGITSVSLQSVLYLLQILLAFRLYYGARNKNYSQCRGWLLVTAVLTAISITFFILNLTVGEYEYRSSITGFIVGLIYKIYEMTVVMMFLRDLKLEVGIGPEFVIGARPQNVELQDPRYPYPAQAYIYITAESQNAYPMQQFSNNPTVNQNYPAPVHHVTTSTIS